VNVTIKVELKGHDASVEDDLLPEGAHADGGAKVEIEQEMHVGRGVQQLAVEGVRHSGGDTVDETADDVAVAVKRPVRDSCTLASKKLAIIGVISDGTRAPAGKLAERVVSRHNADSDKAFCAERQDLNLEVIEGKARKNGGVGPETDGFRLVVRVSDIGDRIGGLVDLNVSYETRRDSQMSGNLVVGGQ
jgi:hypothetical protein